MDQDLRDREGASPAVFGLEPGSVLNGIYRIDRFVTRGGMGDVYAGSNIETEERVAIKVMLPRLAADPKILSLFRNEARLLTRVAHPAVAQYRVFARDAVHGVHYLVTDFIDGDALSTRLRGGAPGADQVARLIRRLAGGLAATHGLGAVHRDMSPDNILLPGGRIDEAKIIDFGIAKYVEPDDRTVVIEGFAGKLGYVAPEQFGLFGNRIGPWTDIYSTGLVLLAFARSEPLDMGRTMAEAMERRAGVPDLAGLPDALHPLFRAMLQPDPDDRPASMAAVVDALDTAPAPAPRSVAATLVAVPPAAAAAIGPSRRGRWTARWTAAIVPSRRRGRWAAGWAAAICLTLLVLWSAWPRPTARVPRPTLARLRAPSPAVAAASTAPIGSPPAAAAAAAAPVSSAAPVLVPTAAPVSAVGIAGPTPAASPMSVALAPRVALDGPAPTLTATTDVRRWRLATWPCRSTGGSPVMATIAGLTAQRPATLLFIAPSGRPLAVFAGAASLRALSATRTGALRDLGHGRYRVLLCARETGRAAFVLVAGAPGMPALPASSAAIAVQRYRALAAAQGWPAGVAWVATRAAARPTRTAPATPTAAATPIPIAAPSPVATRSPPAIAFCRRFKGGRWRDLGMQTRDGCIAAAFPHGAAGYAQFGEDFLRHYAHQIDLHTPSGWERADGRAGGSR